MKEKDKEKSGRKKWKNGNDEGTWGKMYKGYSRRVYRVSEKRVNSEILHIIKQSDDVSTECTRI